ncbi:hypothetical protein [Roseovarius sp. EL26]|uniref:hypothetical protein n=1 Tax=Roseovarius sp. EL26 TaxID=2126672 RepID=UPI000EA01AC6|nr:hypothetical protein [Roseovarius sp. EL26]
MISVSNIHAQQYETTRKISCDVSSKDLPEYLVFDGETNQPLNAPAYLCDWIAIALLYPAMLRGAPLHIEGPISPTLLFNLNNDIQDLLRHFNPALFKIQITALPAGMTSSKPGTDTGSGFSAGVDSFATLAVHTSGDTAPFYQLSSLSTFNVGAMGPVAGSAAIYQRYCQRVQKFATQSGLNWTTVNSNLSDFYVEADANFIRTSTLRNIAAVLFFQDLHKCYLYSSSYSYSHTNQSHAEITYYESILLPLLSTENIVFTLACAGLERSQKIAKVAAYPPSRHLLDVCVSPTETRDTIQKNNCSQCRKCTRTMLNLDILGVLEDFSDVFDLEYFRANREAIIKQCAIGALKRLPLDSDVIQLMRAAGHDARLPLFDRVKLNSRKAKAKLRAALSMSS